MYSEYVRVLALRFDPPQIAYFRARRCVRDSISIPGSIHRDCPPSSYSREKRRLASPQPPSLARSLAPSLPCWPNLVAPRWLPGKSVKFDSSEKKRRLRTCGSWLRNTVGTFMTPRILRVLSQSVSQSVSRSKEVLLAKYCP